MVAFATSPTTRTDALRRRIQKIYAGTTTTFAYDGWRCVAEYENGASASSPARDFVFGTYLDEPLMMVTAPAGAATKRYYHSDHLYSVYALTDSTGAVVERYRYTAYGTATVLTAGFAAKTDPNYSEFGSPWTYTGQRLDAETSLHYYKNRYYSAVLGRFVGRDPIGYEAGSPGLYEYVGSEPTVGIDALGLKNGKKRWVGPDNNAREDLDEEANNPVPPKKTKPSEPPFLEDPSKVNCLSFALGRSRKIVPKTGQSLKEVLDYLGLDCKYIEDEKDCECPCDFTGDLIIGYIYVAVSNLPPPKYPPDPGLGVDVNDPADKYLYEKAWTKSQIEGKKRSAPENPWEASSINFAVRDFSEVEFDFHFGKKACGENSARWTWIPSTCPVGSRPTIGGVGEFPSRDLPWVRQSVLEKKVCCKAKGE